MKKTLIALSTLLLTVLLAVGLTLSAAAEDGIHSGTHGLISWSFDESTGELTLSGNGKMANFEAWNDNVVWLQYKDAVQTITIEEGVTGIGNYAFRNFANLSYVSIPSTVTSIGNSAFYNCTSLCDVQLPEGVESIGGSAFSGCENLGYVFIPDSVTSIGDFAFENCTSLWNISLPSGITRVEDGLFHGAGLGEIWIPDGVESIGSSAFDGCANLQNVNIPETVTSIEQGAFRNCSALCNISLPAGVTTIANSLFYQCTSLSGIEILGDVTEIQDSAFDYCSSLSDIAIPETLTTIGYRAFASCSMLNTVNLPVTLTSIGGQAFRYCGALQQIYYAGSPSEWDAIEKGSYWDDGATNYSVVYNGYQSGKIGNLSWLLNEETGDLLIVGEGAMDNFSYAGSPWDSYASSIQSVTIEEGVTSIGSYAFHNCSNLQSISIPDSVESIGEYAFYYCSTLPQIELSKNSKLATIESYAFSDCCELKSITIPGSVTTIAPNAFANVMGMTDVYVLDVEAWLNVWFGNSISNPTFYGANIHVLNDEGEEMTDLVIPDGITAIPERAFYGFKSLVRIQIPASVTNIGDFAFCNCTGLTTVTFDKGSALANVGVRAFENCTSLESIVYQETIAQWEAVSKGTDWSANTGNFSVSCYTITGTWGDLSWSFDEITGALTISGTGAMNDFSETSTAAWRAHTNAIHSVTIGEGVTSIGAYAFFRCNGLQSVKLPSTLNNVGSNAFFQTSGAKTYITDVAAWLNIVFADENARPNGDRSGTVHVLGSDGNEITELVIPAGVTKIGAQTFRKFTGIVSVSFPNTLESIDELAFLGCNSLESVTFPASLQTIAASAFRACSALTSLSVEDGNANYLSIDNCLIDANTGVLVLGIQSSIIPEDGSVTAIGNEAFYGCTELTEITIPEGITSIGESAFQNCSSLVRISLPNSLESIGAYAFAGCEALLQISIPDSVTAIPAYAFQDCLALESILFAENGSLETIGNYAFWNCIKLANVSIPASVVSIGENVFNGGLLSITFAENSKLTTIGNFAFNTCIDLTEITIPASVQTIGAGAFYDCWALETVIFDSGSRLTKIETNAFMYCKSLASITIPASVTGIGEGAFRGCENLASVYFEDGSNLAYFGTETFSSCTSLESITIPGGVSSLAWNLFKNCTSLKTVTIPTSIWIFEISPFNGCYELSEIIYEGSPSEWNAIQKDSTWDLNIGSYTLTCLNDPGNTWGDLTWEFDEITGELTIFGTGAMNDFLANSTDAWRGFKDSIQSIVIKDGVTSIGEYAFSDCTSLTSIKIPNSVTAIAVHAFENCLNLVSITYCGTPAEWQFASGHTLNLPNEISYHEGDGWNQTDDENHEKYCSICEKYVSAPHEWDEGNVTVPATHTSEGEILYTCLGCGANKSQSIERLPDHKHGDWMQMDSETHAKSCECGDTVTEPHTWNDGEDFTSDGGTPSTLYTCTACGETKITDRIQFGIFSNLTWSLNLTTGELTISGEGAMPGLNLSSSMAWKEYKTFIKSVTIENGITHIGLMAFENCQNLVSVTLPDSVTSIGNNAFIYCTSLTDITFGNSITSIGDSAFKYCTSLTSISLPDNVTGIGNSAFYNCTALNEVILGNGLKTIGNSAFEYCSSLFEITIPDQVSTLGSRAFYNCTNLTYVTIGNGIKTISESAFHYCTALTSIMIPDTVTSIGKSAFAGCQALNTLIIGNGVTSIGESAFQGCSALTSIEIPNAVTSIGNSAFYRCTNLENIAFGSGVTSIGNSAFYQCIALTEVTLGASITSIGDSAFYDCTSLAEVTFPNSLQTIGSEAFRNCTSLKSITIPSSVSSIKVMAFWSCSSLESIVVENGNATYHSAGNCLIETATKTLILGCKNSEVPTNGSITSIGAGAFYGCKDLTSVIIPKGVTKLGAYAFNGCASLTFITYCGTPEEWEALSKGAAWDSGAGNYAVSCHRYPAGKDKCELCGHFRDGIAALYGYSISLNGDISINFYFDVSEETKNDAAAYILITYPNGTTEKILLSEARTKTAGGVTYYVVNPALPAKEINAIVSARIVRGDGTEGILYEKTIRGYAEALIENADDYSPEQVALMEALIAYGEAASIHFGGENIEHQLTEITPETLAEYAMKQSGSTNEGLRYYGSSVLLESETTIRHYFYLTGGDVSDHTFLIDGQEVTPANEPGTNYWYVDIPNIVSKDLDRVYVLEADGMTIEYSALSYAYAALVKYGEDESKGATCNTVRALYLYNLAANAYFEN